jgi:hypothetical protein
MIVELGRAFQRHRGLKANSAEYAELDAYEQFHGIIGFWTPLSLLSSTLTVFSSASMMLDTTKITQFPSQVTIRVFGAAALLVIITGLRWLNIVPRCYAVVLVIRQAFLRLIVTLAGLGPVVFGLVFVGIFLFGFVTRLGASMLSMAETLVSIIFGDNLAQFYQEFSDGSSEYNLLSLVYMSCALALGLWAFSPVFTVMVVTIYEQSVAPLL